MTGVDRSDGAGTATPRPGPADRPGLGGLAEAITAPVRAVTRMFNHPAPDARPAEVRGSSVVDCAVYVHGERQPGVGTYAEALATARATDDAFVWLGLHEPGPADVEEIAEVFDLDTFAVEDAIKGRQRPKIEPYGDMTFLVVRTTRYVEHREITENSEIVETGDLLLFIGADFVITVRHGDVGGLRSVRSELEQHPDELRRGPWYVVYTILDRVVDDYLYVADRVEDDIDALEEQVFSAQVGSRVARIYQLKRELVEFRRAVVPLHRPLSSMVDGRLGRMPDEVARHFRDVADHLVRTVELILSYDDLLNSILQARLAQVTVDQNNDMRKIAAWAAIAALQTAITGIYGMNFQFLPGSGWQYGFPFLLLVMAVSGATLYRLFRRSGWL
jgi:magnesium transporter